MKYGIIVNGRVTEPVAIPQPLPSWAADDSTFLARMFPGKSGWIVVPEDAVPGTIANGDGTFSNGAPPAKPLFPTVTGSQFVSIAVAAIGFDRVDQLLTKSKAVEILLVKAEKIDRLIGNMPAAIARLKQGASALTDAELADIDTVWKAFK